MPHETRTDDCNLLDVSQLDAPFPADRDKAFSKFQKSLRELFKNSFSESHYGDHK
jgi:hypothetical protein